MNIAHKLIKTLLRQKGGATAEFLISVPALLLLGLGGLQSLFIYDAKTTLTYATFEAAREGAVTHAQTRNMRGELGVRLAPIYGGDGTAGEALESMAESALDAYNPLFTKIEVLNPTREAFDDFGVNNAANGKREIPNDNLKSRSRAVGARSGVNIQDANLLKIKVTYGYKLEVPVINTILPAIMKWFDPGNIVFYLAGRIPVTAVATVRMQSAAWPDSNARASGGGSVGGTPPRSPNPDEVQPPGGDPEEPEEDINANNGNGNQNNTGSGNSNNGSGNGTGTGSGNNNGNGSGNGNNSGNPGNGSGNTTGEQNPASDPEELICEKPPEQSGGEITPEDQGMLDKIWQSIKDGATYGLDFMDGMYEGLKGQVTDLASMVLHPIDTAKGFIALGKAFYNDPVGTATMIGEALGKDFSKLVDCGAFDKGKVIGSYVSPAFMLKLATKLSKFGNLAKALKETKKDFGCASFEPGTLVWSEGGKVPIEQLLVGDKVESRHQDMYTDSIEEIIKLHSRTSPNSLTLVLEGYERINITPEHPVWVQGKGWTRVMDVQRGEIVATAEGDRIVLGSLPHERPTPVRNLTINETHTYFVGESGVWVHNADIVCDLPGMGGPTWVPAKVPWNKGKLKEHFDKHGSEFGAKNKEEYSKMALEFAQRKGDSGILETTKGAFVYRFEPSTNTIFVGSKAGGKIQTFYKWDGRANDDVVNTFRDAGMF